jgi:signal transduction histidine kinase
VTAQDAVFVTATADSAAAAVANAPGAGAGAGARLPALRARSARLVLSYVLLFAVSTAVLLGIAYSGTQRALLAESDALVNAELDGLLEEFRLGGRVQLVRALDDAARLTYRSGAVYLLTDAARGRIAGNLGGWPSARGDAAGWLEFDAAASNDDREAPEPVRARARPLADGSWLLVGTDLSEQQRALARFREAWIRGVAVASLLAALLGMVYIRRVDQRVQHLAQGCQQIVAGDLGRRLPLDGTRDEFDRLAGAVNGMLEHLEQQTRAVRTTFDSTAHDLRGPLHRVRMRLEESLRHAPPDAAVRAALEDSLGDLERVQHTLGTLLTIAQAEAAGTVARTGRVDLAALVQELVELYAPEARARGLALAAEVVGPAWIDGNRQLLAQLVVNLLENATKYVPRGGSVLARVGSGDVRGDGTVVFDVEDDGPGIPAAQRALVLRPFTRLDRDNAQAGSGLGLSLVAAVARLHGATLELRERAPGLGVRCVFRAARTDAPPPAGG